MDGVWALSGGIASGKSTVASMIEARGGIVIDADDIAREVVEVGTPGLQEVVEHFGDDVLHPDGQLNREALGARIFGDETARTTLNRILHPKIFVRSMERMQEASEGDRRPIFYDAALLVESESYKNFHGLVIVAADPEIQRQRLMQRNDLSEDEAQQRIDAQLPIEEKVRVADHVIWNNTTLESLEKQVDNLLKTLETQTETKEETIHD